MLMRYTVILLVVLVITARAATLYTNEGNFTNSVGTYSIETFDDFPVNGSGFGAFSNGYVFHNTFSFTSISIPSDILLRDIKLNSTGLYGTFLVHDDHSVVPPEKYVRPGGQGGSGSAADNDDFRIDFTRAIWAFGFTIGDNRTDEAGESISFHAPDGTVLATTVLPGSTSGSGSPGFVGCICDPEDSGIGYILVYEGSALDDDITFDNVLWKAYPEIVITNAAFTVEGHHDLRWTCDTPGIGFTVQSCTNLIDASWANVWPNAQWPISTNVWKNTNAPLPSAIFYRVRGVE